MITTTYAFECVYGHATAHVACSRCDRVSVRTIKEWCSINPFNTIDGETATREQVRAQAQKKAEAEASRLETIGRICAKCAAAAAPAWALDHIEHDNLKIAIDEGKAFAQAAKELNLYYSQMIQSFVGRDIMVYHNREQRLARITEYAYYSGEWSVGYRVYSKAKHAAPGTLLIDTHWCRLDERFFTGSNKESEA